MMMIVFLILIYFNGLLVSSEGNYLSFLHPADYSILNGHVDHAINVPLPSLIRFGPSCYTDAWISTNGLISLGTSYLSYYPSLFPIATPVIAPYWDDNDLSKRGEIRYAVVTAATNLLLCNQVNDYLSTSTGSSVSVEWILWAYWYDVCPFTNANCNNIQSNHYQVALAFQSNATYAVFIYKCGLIRWTRNKAGVGINSGHGYYINHPLSHTYNVTDIDCYRAISGWSNAVYRIDEAYQSIDKFEFLSITSHSITVSWELSIPDISSTLILSITDSHQTVNDEIDVTRYDKYSYTKATYLCNLYTFKLTLPVTAKGCINDNKILSTELIPIPQNISALYLFNETLIIKLKINWCYNNEIYIELLLSVNKTFNVSKSLHINNLHHFYITKWNIKLNRHSLYYLTVTGIGMYETSTSNATKISMHNVKDIIIKRNEDTTCFICVTEIFNDCQVLVASARTTLIPLSIQTNGTCYSFTDNGTYTVYAHDIENGLIILTPAVVIQYTVDWIEPSEVRDQSHIILILGSYLGFSAFANLILFTAVLVLLRNKCKTKPQSSAPSDLKDAPVKTEVNAAYELTQRRSNQIETSNEIQVSQNCSYADTTIVDNAHISPIYDDIPASYEIPSLTVNQ